MENTVADLEASLAAAQAEKATLERQRSAGKPPRPPSPGGGAATDRGSPRVSSPLSPFARSGSGQLSQLESQLAAATLQIASLEVQVLDAPRNHPDFPITMRSCTKEYEMQPSSNGLALSVNTPSNPLDFLLLARAI